MDGDVVAGAGGLQGQGLADPATRAGDQGRAARLCGSSVDAAELDGVQDADDAEEDGDDTDGEQWARLQRKEQVLRL
ncbi:hypothetical protein ACRAWD_21125 [Caulobacter segnis]